MKTQGLTREELREELKRAADEILNPAAALRKQLRLEKVRDRYLNPKRPRGTVQTNRQRRRLNSLADQGVYIIGCGGFPIKIGIAKDANKRLSGIQTGCPQKLRIYAHFEVSRSRAPEVERECHKRLADYRLSGEWFDVDPYDALALVRTVIQELGAAP